MYLFLENDLVIPSCNILFIIDYIQFKTPINKGIFNSESQKKEIINLAVGNEKSVIVTDKNIYFSSCSTHSLKKRMKEFFNIVGGIEK